MLISACSGKNICISLPVLTRPSNSWGSWKNNISGLWYTYEITPSWNGEFSSKSILGSGLISIFFGLSNVGILTGLGGGL